MKTRLWLLPLFLLLFSACGLPPAASGTPQPATPGADVTPAATGTPFVGPEVARYEIGSPKLTDLWLDPVNGDDTRDGTSQAGALKTLTAAWDKIPKGQTLTQGYRLRILPGKLPAESLPVYWESRYGSAAAPILIQAEGGPGTVTLQGYVNVYDVQYLYFDGLDIIPQPAGDAFHCEKCSHVLIRHATINGGSKREAQEALKVNQSQYFYIEDSDISGADDNAIDFVAVQYAHVFTSRIHDANDWCAYAKGGSAYVRYEGNEIFNCGTGGFTAGQGTGLQFMVAPWYHYEAYGVQVVNNIIHDTQGAGLGVNGGYNIMMAYNTLYKVGSRSHLIEVVYGQRSCDGQPGDEGRERCQQYLDAGAWGTTVVDNGTNAVFIPNRNVYIYNNIIYNPAGSASGSQYFAIYGPADNPDSSNIASVVTDDNLQIRGNVIWNGGANLPLGIEGPGLGCQPENTTCNGIQLGSENAIDIVEPQFVDAPGGDFHLRGNWADVLTPLSMPDFIWDDHSVPVGTTVNTVTLDRDGKSRSPANAPGAYTK